MIAQLADRRVVALVGEVGGRGNAEPLADLLVSSTSPISFRTGLSGDLAVLQQFYVHRPSAVSAAYRAVLARLQCGCSKST